MSSRFDPKVQEALDDIRLRKEEAIEDSITELADLVSRCESPLEQMLLLEFSEVFAADPVGAPDDKHLRGVIIFPNVDRFSVAIRLQHPISLEKANYRADFLVTLEDWDWNAGKHVQLVKLVVEVDGHDYHERTKEQARYDKSRDRAMIRSGIVVMRFTGSEVFRDPSSVASEVEQFLLDQATKLLA